MTLTQLTQAFVTLFVVIDPIGAAPIFMAMTGAMSPARRRSAAWRAAVLAFAVLALFALAGEAMLRLSGISLDAFRISGGLLLFLIAVEMLFEKRTQRRGHQADEVEDDPAIFPLGIPLTAGPGAMAGMVLLSSQHPGALWQAALIGVMGAVVAVTLALFLAAGMLARVVGRTGINVLTRLFGVLLAALAVQFVVDGIAGLRLAGV